MRPDSIARPADPGLAPAAIPPRGSRPHPRRNPTAAVAAGDDPDSEPSASWAASQLHYLLGDNPRQQSYMIGYSGGSGMLNYPRRPHHRGASCPSAADGDCTEEQLCDACDSPWILQ